MTRVAQFSFNGGCRLRAEQNPLSRSVVIGKDRPRISPWEGLDATPVGGCGRCGRKIKRLRDQGVVNGNFRELSQERISILREDDSDAGSRVTEMCRVQKGPAVTAKMRSYECYPFMP